MSGQVDFPEGKGPGTWQRTIEGEFTEAPRWSVLIWCPECRLPLLLTHHKIDASGQVSPSVGHPDVERYRGCTWHETPRLLGWVVLPPPEPRPVSACVLCGTTTRALGGWGITGDGLTCPACMTTQRGPR